MNYDEIKEIVMKRINENKLTAVFDSYDKINVANGVVIINNLVTIRDVYVIHEVGDETLWINNNSMKTEDVKDFKIYNLYYKKLFV